MKPNLVKPFAAAFLVLAAILTFAAHPAEAKKKFYFGLGPNTTSPSGDIDGQLFFTAGPNGPDVYPGKLADGNGLSLLAGAYLYEIWALELMMNVSTHDSTHSKYPGETISASYGAFLLGGRVYLPLGDRLELFGRAMIGGAVLSYDGNTELPPRQVRLDSSFSGNAVALGGGARYTLDQIGIELSYMNQSVVFDSLDAANTTGAIDDLNEDFGVLQLMLVIGFGNDA